VAKAYSGLTDEEIRRVDRFVRANTVDKFGRVRSVKPELVFELALEGIQRSTRHKSGIAIRFPRIARWRRQDRLRGGLARDPPGAAPVGSAIADHPSWTLIPDGPR
jgi:ATP-dependent DNA ligase